MPQAFVSLIILILVLPVLATLAWNLWLSYLQTIFLGKIKWVLLEIKPPKDVFKSPLAMELVLNSLYQTGGVGNWYQKYWQGNLRQWFSLEIVSTEGAIHFYLRTPDRFRKLVESQIYAQYPQAEVMEVEDYANRMPEFEKGGPIGVWGSNLTLTKEDPYPIKTYVDFGLDRAIGTLAEEERIDPITPMLEFMGSLGAGEHLWFQIIVRGDTPRFTVKKDGVDVPGKKWTDAAKEIIKKFNDDLKEKDADGKVTGRRTATKGELAVIESIERNANKYGFDSAIRVAYITNEGKFDANRIPGILGMLRQFGAPDYNGFKPEGITGGHDFPWQDVFGSKTLFQKKQLFADYKKRKYFYGEFNIANPGTYFTHPNASGKKPFILSTEELATLYHLPGRVAETPTFERIESKKGEAPGNLPI